MKLSQSGHHRPQPAAHVRSDAGEGPHCQDRGCNKGPHLPFPTVISMFLISTHTNFQVIFFSYLPSVSVFFHENKTRGLPKALPLVSVIQIVNHQPIIQSISL